MSFNTESFSLIWEYEIENNIAHIPDDVQEKLLSDYEAELKTKKPTHAKKDSNASDDWEKVSNWSWVGIPPLHLEEFSVFNFLLLASLFGPVTKLFFGC